jgi:hypothetical protein
VGVQIGQLTGRFPVHRASMSATRRFSTLCEALQDWGRSNLNREPTAYEFPGQGLTSILFDSQVLAMTRIRAFIVEQPPGTVEHVWSEPGRNGVEV